jgi:thioredoxin reductase (NADPH)
VAAERFDVVVIGEGVAGLSAAGAAAQGGAKAASFEHLLCGGLVANINVLEPSPSEPGISGVDFASSLVQANLDRGVKSIQHTVNRVERAESDYIVHTAEATYRANRIVVATGASLRPLGIPGEAEFAGHGVSNCADCDGPLYRGRKVVVVGGGDSAVQESLVLSDLCERVYVVTRGRGLSARPDLIARIAGRANVSIIPRSEPIRILGNGGVEQVAVRCQDGSLLDLPCAAVFPYVGLVPNIECIPDSVERDSAGRLLTNSRYETSLPGVFAAGAVRAGYAGILTDALREGGMAGRSALASLSSK